MKSSREPWPNEAQSRRLFNHNPQVEGANQVFLVGGNRICEDGRVFTGKIQKLRLFGSCFLYYCKRRLPAKRKHRQSLKAARSLVFEKVSLRYPRSAGWFDRKKERIKERKKERKKEIKQEQRKKQRNKESKNKNKYRTLAWVC